jgi:hypothetical protein
MAMQLNPGASLSTLGSAIKASRSAVVARIHRLARRGGVTKGADGHWRVATSEPEPQPPPGSERGECAFPSWIKPLSNYGRRSESSFFDCARFG